jgi:uncharacterized protein (TIGR03435 family)
MNFRCAAVLLAIGLAASAQPAFEVASVKPTPRGSIGYTSISPSGAGTFTATNVTMEFLIALAFGFDSDRIYGKQNWLSSEHYDVSAKPEGDRGLSYEQLRPMLQHLLADRFKLSVHREMKDSQGYALTVTKGGPKLQVTKGGPSKPVILKAGLRADNISLGTFVALLARPVGRQVVDKTAITGSFDITLDYAPEGVDDTSLPSIFTALQEQLGLKLTPQKIPVETLVIDHVERIPSEN